MNLFDKIKQTIRLTLLCVLVIAGSTILLWAQKYNFINYNVENGLAQSQVTVFAQTINNELLIGTFGGLSVFDGIGFYNLNKGNHLPYNMVHAVTADQKMNIWIGSNNTITRYDGKQFKTFYPDLRRNDNANVQLLTDAQNTTWALIDFKLFYFGSEQFVPFSPNDTITAFTLDNNGQLWFSVYKKGIYTADHFKSKLQISTNGTGIDLVRSIRFGKLTGTLYVNSNKGLMSYQAGKFEQPTEFKNMPQAVFNGFMEDSKGNIWVLGQDGGAWVYNGLNWLHYNYANGLTDDWVTNIFEDREGCIWLGTNGSGIYKYTGSLFVYYNRSSGIPSPSIMSVAAGNNKALFAASNSSGLFQVVNGALAPVALPKSVSKLNAILSDTQNNLWIGTIQNGLWIYKNGQAKPAAAAVKNGFVDVSHLYQYQNSIWVSSVNGLLRIEGEKAESLLQNVQVHASLMIGQDSLLVGTLKGAYIFHVERNELSKQPLVANSTTLCFAQKGDQIFIGTDDKGVVVWNKQTKKFSTINKNNGLTCDYIYSLLCDRQGNLWVGTGCGIDRISFSEVDRTNIKSFGKSDGLLGVENNANASFEDAEGYIWFGTTKGLFRYNPYLGTQVQKPPVVQIQAVKLFSKTLDGYKYSDSLIPFKNFEWLPILPASQNHLTFEYRGISLASPEKIKYRYQLIGADKTFTETENNYVVYPNLPPGSYVFKVWACDAEGKWYNNAAVYPFQIKAPYYTTTSFKLGIGFLVVGLFLGGVYLRNRNKEARRKWQEQLREQEQAAVRKKTAEDFHDEIGNKLTRINLLTTIAQGKVSQQGSDLGGILSQIQTNVASLYNGAKDIIWSLQPESDYLNEILFRIKQNTDELLQDSTLKFVYEEQPQIDTHIKLPIDCSRNLIMIFKEAVTNVVKHAQATQIHMQVQQNASGISLTLQDDGLGMPTTYIPGNGLGNMENRAKRMGATLALDRPISGGTRLSLYLPLR